MFFSIPKKGILDRLAAGDDEKDSEKDPEIRFSIHGRCLPVMIVQTLLKIMLKLQIDVYPISYPLLCPPDGSGLYQETTQTVRYVWLSTTRIATK